MVETVYRSIEKQIDVPILKYQFVFIIGFVKKTLSVISITNPILINDWKNINLKMVWFSDAVFSYFSFLAATSNIS